MAVTAITASKDTAPTTAPTTKLLELSGVSAGETRAEKCQFYNLYTKMDTSSICFACVHICIYNEQKLQMFTQYIVFTI